MKPILSSIILISSSIGAHAALMIYEGFSAPPYSGDIVGENGGFGWSSAWTSPGSSLANSFDSEENGLSLLNNEATNGGLAVSVPANFSAPLDRQFDTSGFGETIYLGYLINVTASSMYNYFYTRLQSQSGYALVGHISGTTWRASLQDSGDNFVNALIGDEDVDDGITTHLVMKIEFNQNGSNERITLYTNPSVNEESIFLGQSRNDIDIGQSLTGQLQLGVSSNLTARVDEIRIGTTYESMFGSIPEPNTLLLLLIGGGCCLNIRKRNSPPSVDSAPGA